MQSCKSIIPVFLLPRFSETQKIWLLSECRLTKSRNENSQILLITDMQLIFRIKCSFRKSIFRPRISLTSDERIILPMFMELDELQVRNMFFAFLWVWMENYWLNFLALFYWFGLTSYNWNFKRYQEFYVRSKMPQPHYTYVRCVSILFSAQEEIALQRYIWLM